MVSAATDMDTTVGGGVVYAARLRAKLCNIYIYIYIYIHTLTNDTTQTFSVYLCLFADTTCMSSESCSEVSVLLRHGVKAGTQKSMKTELSFLLFS
jgi:hypothetical protein